MRSEPLHPVPPALTPPPPRPAAPPRASGVSDATQRYVERPCRADPSPTRLPDRFDPTPNDSHAVAADEHIPGRLPFALYLDRLNRFARAARTPQAQTAPIDHATITTPRQRPTPRPTETGAASLAAPAPTTPATTPPAPPDTPPLRLIATRRGSILDVLA
ncbi:MAG: hypothetical protein KDA05_01885 [Phycisphaerales bacterium]|nr:hypothetical protein [Phycisphaerales bacterium]